MTPMQSAGNGYVFDGARAVPPSRAALVILAVAGLAACGPSNSGTGPEGPGSIFVTTETTGFLQDDSYELLVDGVGSGTIGANDEMTVSGLDPATYDVELGDLAENCTVDGALAEVASAETTDVSMSVACTAPAPSPYYLRANRDRPNLEDGVITECTFGICPSDDTWDIYVYFDTQSDPQSVIRQNQTTGVEIAHVTGVSLGSISESDVEAATFTTELVAEPFGTDRVILVRTDQGNVYGLGNPIENTLLLTLTFDAVLLVSGP